MQKIVETSEKHPDVLLYVSKNDDGEAIVIIHAFGTIVEEGQEDLEDIIATENVLFSSFEMANNYVKDFSKKSAISFCEEYRLKYQPN